MEGIQTLKILDLGSGHMAYRRASLIDLYLHTKFHSNRRNFLWTDGRTYGRTDIFFPSNIIRSTFGSRPKKGVNYVQRWMLIQFRQTHRRMGTWLSQAAGDRQQSTQSLQALHTGYTVCPACGLHSETLESPGILQIALHDEDRACCRWYDTAAGRRSHCQPLRGKCQDLSLANHTARSARHIAHMLQGSGRHQARWDGLWQTGTQCLQTLHIIVLQALIANYTYSIATQTSHFSYSYKSSERFTRDNSALSKNSLNSLFLFICDIPPNSAVADKLCNAFVQMQWRGWPNEHY